MNQSRSVKILVGAIGSAVVILFIFCLFQLPKLNTRYSVQEFFPKKHPALEQSVKTSKQFQLAERPAYFLSLKLNATEKGTWLQSDRVQELEKVTARIQKIKGVKSVLSLANLDMAIEGRDSIQIGPVLKSLPQSKWKQFVEKNALVRSQLISADLKSVMLLVEPTDQSAEVLKSLSVRLIEQTPDQAKRWTPYLGGVPAVQVRLSDRLQQEVGLFFGLTLFVFCIMFFMFYRNLVPIAFAMVGLVIVNVTSLGLMSLIGVPFTVLLSTTPMIASIAFVSLAIHTLHLWSDRLKNSNSLNARERFDLSLKVLKELGMPNFLGSLTTSIGFVTLAAANIPAIRTYGLVIAAIVLWTWLITQVMFLGFLWMLNVVPREWNQTRAWWMIRANRWSIPVVSLTIALTIVGGSFFGKLNFSARLFDDLPVSDSVRIATEFLDRNFGGTISYDVVLTARDATVWKDPSVLKKLQGELRQLRKIEGVGSALSVPDFLGEKIPQSRAALAETYFLFSMASENPLRQFLSNDEKSLRIAFRLQDRPSSQIAFVRSSVVERLQSFGPQFQVRESGLAVNSHTINQEVAHELVSGFWHSLVIIGILLLFIFRSVRWALVACLPNLVPPGVLIGALALFQTPVKPGIALIFSIALGLAFNNTVYLLSRMKRVQDERKMKRLPLRRSLLEEGNPCLGESLIMFAGFLIFLASGFELNQNFGIYMILSIFAGAVADLIFLPAVLREFPNLLWKADKSEPRLVEEESVVVELKPALEKIQFVEKAEERPRDMTIAAAWFVFVFLSSTFAFLPRTHANEAEKILKLARTHLESKSDEAKVKLKIIEPSGEIKTRELSLQTLRQGSSFKALVRIQAPADIKGTSLLAEIDNGQERQWVYLPSSKQVRRIASVQKSTGVLGSELSPADLNPEAMKGAKIRLVQKNEKMAILELIPKPKTSEYSKVLTTFSLPQGLPQKTEYFVGSKVLKTVEFKNYKQVDGKVYRAQLIQVKNLQKNRGTDLELSGLKVNSGLTSKDFTQASLKDDW